MVGVADRRARTIDIGRRRTRQTGLRSLAAQTPPAAR